MDGSAPLSRIVVPSSETSLMLDVFTEELAACALLQKAHVPNVLT